MKVSVFSLCSTLKRPVNSGRLLFFMHPMRPCPLPQSRQSHLSQTGLVGCFCVLSVCLFAHFLFDTAYISLKPCPVLNLLVIGLHGFTGRLQAAAMGACGGCVRMGIFDESSPTLMVQQVWAVWY